MNIFIIRGVWDYLEMLKLRMLEFLIEFNVIQYDFNL